MIGGGMSNSRNGFSTAEFLANDDGVTMAMGDASAWHAAGLILGDPRFHRPQQLLLRAMGEEDRWKVALVAHVGCDGSITLITHEPLPRQGDYELWKGTEQPVAGEGHPCCVILSRPGMRVEDAEHPFFVSYVNLK